MATKKCTKCKQDLPFSAFHKRQRSRDGLACKCRTCRSMADKRRRVTNPEKGRASGRRWKAANPESEWRRVLRRRYGMAPADYWQLSAQQEGLCGICGVPETAMYKGKVRKMTIDHDHETGEIRGLLCSKCNLAIGLLKDDPALLEAGIGWVRTAKTGIICP